MNALEQIDIDEAQEIQTEQKQFKIENLEQATWAFRKISAYKAKQNEIDEVAKEETERIRTWQQKESETIKSGINFFEVLLQQYFVEQREQNPKFKISTPYGKVTARKQPDKWEYDESKILEWLDKNEPEFIRIKKEINKALFKKSVKVLNGKAVDENGEIVPGVIIIPQPETIKVEAE
jgi:hypothetical protein